MFFSIIVPCFNSEAYIEETINSLLSQTYHNYEIIVIDGASTDSTLDILQKHGNSICVYSEPDGGMYDAINKGILRAKGDIISYLNSDDLYHPDTLLSIVQYLKKTPLAVADFLLYSDLHIVDQNTRLIRTHYYPHHDLNTFLLSNHSLIGQPASFWARSLHYKHHIWFDTNLRMAADYKFYIQARLSGISFIKLTNALAYYRVHSSSLTSTLQSINKKELETIKADFPTCHSALSLTNYIRTLIFYYSMNFSRKLIRHLFQ